MYDRRYYADVPRPLIIDIDVALLPQLPMVISVSIRTCIIRLAVSQPKVRKIHIRLMRLAMPLTLRPASALRVVSVTSLDVKRTWWPSLKFTDS